MHFSPVVVLIFMALLLTAFRKVCRNHNFDISGRLGALEEHELLKKLLLELQDDSSMSDAKWEELLPICRYADARLITEWPEIAQVARLEEFVLAIMKDSEEELPS